MITKLGFRSAFKHQPAKVRVLIPFKKEVFSKDVFSGLHCFKPYIYCVSITFKIFAQSIRVKMVDTIAIINRRIKDNRQYKTQRNTMNGRMTIGSPSRDKLVWGLGANHESCLCFDSQNIISLNSFSVTHGFIVIIVILKSSLEQAFRFFDYIHDDSMQPI